MKKEKPRYLKEGFRYRKEVAGRWFQPIQRGYLMACCDCALVHKMNFRVVGGLVQIQAFRMVAATKMLRKRKRGLVCMLKPSGRADGEE